MRGLVTFTEWKSAWHGVRSRGWAGVFVVVLLAVALAANAVMFSVADSLVFRRQPFEDADRIFTVTGKTKSPERLDLSTSVALLQKWREQSDLVAAVGGFANKTVFLRGGGAMEEIATLDVTVGFLDVLGVRPRWGRGFTEGDERDPATFAVILSEDLARKRFGSPDLATGQTIEASAGQLTVVGVMDRTFVYPDSRYQMWRALDPAGPLMRNFGGLAPIVRVNPQVPFDSIDASIRTRAAQVGASAGLSSYEASLRPLFAPA